MKKIEADRVSKNYPDYMDMTRYTMKYENREIDVYKREKMCCFSHQSANIQIRFSDIDSHIDFLEIMIAMLRHLQNDIITKK